MKTYKEHRFKNNPKEKEFFERFKKEFENNPHILSAIVFGWQDNSQIQPKRYLTETETEICANLIQWLGSPVGQRFLQSCGFINNENN